MAEHEHAPDQTPTREDRETLVEIARLIATGAPSSDLEGPGTASGGGTSDMPVPASSQSDVAFAGLMPEQLIEAIPAGVALARDLTLVKANRSFALAFGYRSGSDIVDAGGLSAVLPGLTDALTRAAHDTLAGGHLQLDLTARSRSGRGFSVPVAVHTVSADGGLRLIALHPGPMTSVHEPETARAAARPTADAPIHNESRLGVDFLARVSHEVRTPLNSIIGFAELMAQEPHGPLGHERYRGYIRDIQESGLYALSLVNDLLDLSKIRSGGFEIDFVAVDLADAIAEAAHVMQPQARSARVVLRTAIGADIPPVLADRRSLKQILLNLMSNAVKFTPPGGQVIASLALEPGGKVRLAVRDTGVGMTQDEIALALEPFRQIDTAPRHRTGTGLGLPLTRALVQANRAQFSIESDAGRGTCIDVTFSADRVVL